VADKLNIPQVTYAEEITDIGKKDITIKRRLERGVELVKVKLPVLVTVHSSAPPCRPRNARLLMKFKHAKTVTELQDASEDYLHLYETRSYLTINEWTADEIDVDEKALGLSGSPTKVKKIESVVFKAKESKVLKAGDEEIDELMKELIENHTIG
jgi:electron transfer flavoprotein beta subunit